MQTDDQKKILNDVFRSRFVIREEILFRQVENEAILLHLIDGMYYSLNETSVPFWKALRDQKPLESAVAEVMDHYDVEFDQVIQDLASFLQNLLHYNLIASVGEDSGSAIA